MSATSRGSFRTMLKTGDVTYALTIPVDADISDNCRSSLAKFMGPLNNETT